MSPPALPILPGEDVDRMLATSVVRDPLCSVVQHNNTGFLVLGEPFRQYEYGPFDLGRRIQFRYAAVIRLPPDAGCRWRASMYTLNDSL
jgi:hypothetical protein